MVERAQAGDRDAYERLALQSADRLFGIAYRVVRDIDRAQDAVQQTMVAMWTEIGSLRDPERFEVWTYRLVVRFALAEGRRHRRLGVVMGALEADLPAPRDAIDDMVVRDQLDAAFRQLRPDHRAVLVLHHYLGLSNLEIASVLGVPAGTVGSRLHRATREMRASLEAGARPAEGRRALA